MSRGTIVGLIVSVALLAGLVSSGGGATRAQDGAQPGSIFSPIAGGFTLLVNLDEASDPASMLASIDDFVSAAFAFDAALGRFRSFRVGQPALSDLRSVGRGTAFWVFVPPERLDGDLTFWEQPASVRNMAQDLVPGFNLVGWTGSDGVPISEAVDGLPVRKVFSWDVAAQRFEIWDPTAPASISVDFALDYGQGMWLDLGGTEAVVWLQP